MIASFCKGDSSLAHLALVILMDQIESLARIVYRLVSQVLGFVGLCV
jgi:hypothetical protein